jgi:hypothetical protein
VVIVPAKDGAVVKAVRGDLALLGDRRLAGSALAATALALAGQLDNPKSSATAKAMCAGKLIEALDRLRELAPPRKETDDVDEVQAKREARRAAAGVAAAKTLARS